MIGKRLDQWVIDKELGRGGMGKVFLAHEELAGDGNGRQAAIKVLAPELAQETGFLKRFQREIDALSILDHPHIVRLYGSGVHEGRYYYAMEYVAGKNYDELLREKGKIPWKEVLEVALQLCPALKHAHDHGIIHRDIKPPNLLRTEDGVVKLTDFGIAKVFAGKQLTATNSLVGTAEFLSPEQAAGKPVTNRSDLYSLGVVLYTLLTGRTPFQGVSLVDLLHKHRFAQFDPPIRYEPDMPYELDAIVCQLLEKEPDKRPRDGLVLHRQLDRLRRKYDRHEQFTIVGVPAETQADSREAEESGEDEPGPATLMSRLMRQELDTQARGGPLAQFFNRPMVLIPLFIFCVGLLVWGVWPRPKPSAETLFQNGAELMASDDPADWDMAWEKYFSPLERSFPNHPYQDDLDRFRLMTNDHAERSRIMRRSPGPESEAQRFYQLGQRLCLERDFLAAKRVWQDMVRSFGGITTEDHWVRLAKQGLADLEGREPTAGHRWDSTRQALERARQLRDRGKRKEAEGIWAGIEHLYQGDPSAREILEEVKKDRGQ
jgi:serine/threonine-protein kinase